MNKIALTINIMFIYQLAFGQQIAGTGSYNGNPGFDRGMQSTQWCGNNPESWVRGSAWLDKQTGQLTMQVQLETDATHAGPKGQVVAYIYDYSGNLIAKVASAEVGMGGKPPGKAVIRTFQATFNCGPNIGNQAAKISVVANCTGWTNQWFGVSTDQIRDAVGFIQQFAMFFAM